MLSGIFCPLCESSGQGEFNEMTQNGHMIHCRFGHSLDTSRADQNGGDSPDYLLIQKAKKRKLTIPFTPTPGQVKVDFFCQDGLAKAAKEKLGQSWSPTLENFLRIVISGNYAIIDGEQAVALNKKGIKNGRDVLILAEEADRLTAENERLTQEVNRWEALSARALSKETY